MKPCLETKVTEQYAVGPQQANNVMVVRKQKTVSSNERVHCVCALQVRLQPGFGEVEKR